MNVGSPPVIGSIQIRVPTGSVVTRLTPQATYFVEVTVSDGDGFGDVDSVEVLFFYRQLADSMNAPSREARYAWRRGPLPHWVRVYPAASTWDIVAAQCAADSTTNSTAPQVVRFAIVPSRVALATTHGYWTVRVIVHTASEQNPVSRDLPNLDMAEYMVFATLSPRGAFTPAYAGATDLPLVTPPSGSLTLGVVSNAAGELDALGAPLLGEDSLEVNIPIGWPDYLLRYALTPGGSGKVENSFWRMARIDPNVIDVPNTYQMELGLDHPPDAYAQRYSGFMLLKLLASQSSYSTIRSVPITATVVSGGFAADSARGEVQPLQVVAGTTGQSFTASVRAFVQGANSGVNMVRVGLPAGYGTPSITGVRWDGAPHAFTDRSVFGWVEAGLDSTVTRPRWIDLDFRLEVPRAADPLGSDFPIFIDDTTTSLPVQAARPGDVNGAADGDGWSVVVEPGPASRIDVIPAWATLTVGDSAPFSASLTDPFGNAVSAPVSWRGEGAAGSVDSIGEFTAIAIGTARVIAESGSLSDTAIVTVSQRSAPVGTFVAAQLGRPLGPGGPSVEVLRFRIVNRGASPETLVALRLENRATGPGSTAELDADWSPLSLSLAPGSGWVAPSPVPGALASFASREAVFSGLSVAVPALDSVSLVVQGAASLTARDSDVLDLRLDSALSLGFSDSAVAVGDWPLDPAGGFTVDGMTAAQLALRPVLPAGLAVGSPRNLALDVVVPANGYAADQLRSLAVRNLGTARAGTEIARAEAWADDGDGRFDPAADSRLGELYFTGDLWQLTGLTRTVPFAGLRVYVTVDIGELAAAGRTVRLSVPAAPDRGIGVASGNSGPNDAEIDNPDELPITDADRVTLSAAPLDPGPVHPGAAGVPLLTLVATNTYATPRRVTGLTLTNSSTGNATPAELDADFDRIELWLDADDDGVLGDPAVDPIIGSGAFSGGRIRFSGLDWVLPAGSAQRLFVTGAVSPSRAADGDVLSAEIVQALDASFESPTAVAAAWPVTSGARWTVDGMLSAQVTNLGAPGVTLGSADGPAAVLDLIVPRNGHADDVLNGFRVMNSGDAGPGDIREIRLWRDGGDGVFSGGAGDDRDLGPLALLGDGWQSPFLSEPLGASGARLFVSVTASNSPRDSSTVRLEVPVGGIVTASGNSGPIDAAVANPETQVLSSGPLIATLTLDPAASTPGQGVAVEMKVRNVSAENIDNVAPEPLVSSGTGNATMASGPSPGTVDLAPGAEQTFTWSYVAAAPGTLRLSGRATGMLRSSGQVYRSLTVGSGLHQVFAETDSMELFPIQSMPFSVNRGQTDVVPLSLTFSNDAPKGGSSVRLRALRIRLESDDGSGIVPAQLLSRVVVAEGSDVYLAKSNLETSGSEIDLTLATPLSVGRLDPSTVGLSFDILPTTNVASFRAVITDGSSFRAEDAISGAPVKVVLRNRSYPLQSGLARLVASATRLDVTSEAPAWRGAGRGQTGVPLATLHLESPGVAGVTSDVRVVSLVLGLVDEAGQPIRGPGRILQRIRVLGPLQPLAERPIDAADDTAIAVTLTTALMVPAVTPQDLRLVGDIDAAATLGSFRVALRDPARFEARDANSGDLIPVTFPAPPVEGDTVSVELEADSLYVASQAEFPAEVPVGRAGVRALSIRVRHPGGPEVGPIRLDRLALRIQDQARQGLVPATYVDNLTALWNGAPVAVVGDPPSSGDLITVPLPGAMIPPGRTDTLVLVVDFASSAPVAKLELLLDASGLPATDANLGKPVAVAPESGSSLPASSGLVELQPPAHLLLVGLKSAMPAALPPDGAEAPAARISLVNGAAAGSGLIQVGSLTFSAANGRYAAAPIGALAARVTAYVGGSTWASSAPLTPDSLTATLAGNAPLEIDPGHPLELEIRVTPATAAGSGGLRLGLDVSGVGVIQPSSALLAVVVQAAQGQRFPLWTEAGSVSPASLSESYANFPNPFAAGRERTSFVFYLPRPGKASLQIWTARGQRVATLLEDAPLPAGLRQSDEWDGRNRDGSVVTNGVYYAVLVVREDGGGSERLIRKVAVLR